MVLVHSTSTNMAWHMLVLHPLSSLDIQIPCSIIFYHTSIGIRSDHMSYSTLSCTQLLLISSIRISEILLLQFFARTVVALSVSFIQHLWVISTPYFLDITILGQRIAYAFESFRFCNASSNRGSWTTIQRSAFWQLKQLLYRTLNADVLYYAKSHTPSWRYA